MRKNLKKSIVSAIAFATIFGLATVASAGGVDGAAGYVAGNTWQDQGQDINSDQYSDAYIYGDLSSVTIGVYDGASQGTDGFQGVFSSAIVINGNYESASIQAEGYNTVMSTENGTISNFSEAVQQTTSSIDGYGYADASGSNDFGQGTQVYNGSEMTFFGDGVSQNSYMGTSNQQNLNMSGEVFSMGRNADAAYGSTVTQVTGSYQEMAVPGGTGFTFSQASQTGTIDISTD